MTTAPSFSLRLLNSTLWSLVRSEKAMATSSATSTTTPTAPDTRMRVGMAASRAPRPVGAAAAMAFSETGMTAVSMRWAGGFGGSFRWARPSPGRGRTANHGEGHCWVAPLAAVA